MMLICLGGGRDDSAGTQLPWLRRDVRGELSGLAGVLLCLCTIGIPVAGTHDHPHLIPAHGTSLLQLQVENDSMARA